MHGRGVIHKLLQALVESPAHRILPARHRAELRGQHHAIQIHPVHAKHIQRPLQVVLEERVFADRIAGFADQLDGLIHVRVIGELHREKRISELPRLVGHSLDLAERYRVHKALAVTQAQRTNGQPFDRAGMARIEHHPVTNRQRVLDDDEQPGNDVLHQLLRTETDGQTDHTRTGQQRRDVNPKIGHGGDRANHHKDDFDRVAQQRQDGFHPRARLACRAFAERRFQRFLNCRVEHYPQQPCDQEDQADAAQRVADGSSDRAALGKIEERYAPDPPEDVDEGNGDDDPQQGMQEAEETFLVGTAALDCFGLSRLEQVLQDRAEKHRADQQHRGEQRAAQGLLIVLADTDQVDRRDQHHQHDWPIPQPGKDPQRLLQRGLFQPLAQRTIADQMRHRAAQANHQQTKNDGGDQPGEHRDAAGDIAAQLAGDLRAGQRIAESSEEADQEQRTRAVIADDPRRRTFMADVEHHHHAQQHRGGKDTAAGGVGQTQRQRAANRSLQEMADVEGQRQADQRWNGVRQQISNQILTTLTGAQPATLAQAFGQQAAEHGEQRETAEPSAGQREEIPGDAPARAIRRLVDQFVDFIGGAIGAQAPGIDQVFV
ncbi:hypothetical protein NZ35_11505 [Pseudomonas chlororaphis]|uniref:Uncharacterized protein n=1 Tax=Pseudomonas chlororaphis TaxID=587753 RepID=A0A0A6FKS5_9PSED|nr:hypothetical protein NZ35_11505 [Pseudomonas chlororaphis]